MVVARTPLVRAALIVAGVVLSRTARVHAQGRWEFGAGVFQHSGDTLSTSGVAAEFVRWPGAEVRVRHGFRLAYYRRRIDDAMVPQPVGSQFTVSERFGAWGIDVGVPFQVGPIGTPIRPFVEADPGLMLYNSIHSTRFTRISNGKVGLEDESGLHIGPTLGLGAGLQFPGSTRGPRFRVKASYRLSLLAGKEGTGMSGALWKAWDLMTGGSIGY